MGLMYFKQNKNKEKSGIFSKARGGGQGTIFRLLSILLKTADGTNREMCK